MTNDKISFKANTSGFKALNALISEVLTSRGYAPESMVQEESHVLAVHFKRGKKWYRVSFISDQSELDLQQGKKDALIESVELDDCYWGGIEVCDTRQSLLDALDTLDAWEVTHPDVT